MSNAALATSICPECGFDRELGPLARLDKDTRAAAALMNRDQARFLVDEYYSIQENRKASGNQVMALEKSEVTKQSGEVTAEPTKVIEWVHESMEVIEGQIQLTLGKWAKSQPLGQWALDITGIGPVIAAGLLCHIDIHKASTVGKIWRFAGLDPTVKWEKGQKRPWNAALKVLCWKIGESFVKVSGNKNDIYGQIYLRRKEVEMQKNEEGEFAEQAKAILATKRIDKSTEAWAWYSGCYPGEVWLRLLEKTLPQRQTYLKQQRLEPGQGVHMLPPAHIHSRAKRVAVKLFLAHYHEAAYFHILRKKPPFPYVIEHMKHTDYIPAPNLDWGSLEAA